MIYFVHHATDVFLFWAFLFLTTRGEYIFHACIVFLTVIHWLTYKNRCIATVWLNRRCGYDEDVWLDSILNRLALRTRIGEYYQIVWLGLVLLWWAIMSV